MNSKMYTYLYFKNIKNTIPSKREKIFNKCHSFMQFSLENVILVPCATDGVLKDESSGLHVMLKNGFKKRGK